MLSSDHQLAQLLQEQFQNEYEVEKSAESLVYDKSRKHNLNSSKCLVDPSWEVIDPTPDIHILFMTFSERFFWNKLMSVCVSWSKRMTSCAGVCTYEGRGGMCTITLSEPLLKLRPRKDLVETLLHEMIHAYLFVTHNNRDRDGHGPEFHKHMNRINSESGTNITVYHDFHDEVRLYQQHWWRCNGPCQNWKPYYGIVKRSINRAPGPADRWWGEHYRSCGGEFIKVKEPEKPKKKEKPAKKKPETISKPLPDIRKHFSPTKSMGKSIPSASNSNNITTPTVKSVDLTDYAVVRNHWLKKFSNNGTAAFRTHSNPFASLASNPNMQKSSHVEIGSSNEPINSSNNLKRESDDSPNDVPQKVLKFNEDASDNASTEVKCPICSRHFAAEEINNHLDKCLCNHKECIICHKNIPASVYEKHLSECNGTAAFRTPSNPLASPTSNPSIMQESLHVEVGSSNEPINNSNNLKRESDDSPNGVPQKLLKFNEDASHNAPTEVKCPICSSHFAAEEINNHLDKCLCKNKECIICHKNIPASVYEKHLSECCNRNSKEQVVSDSSQKEDVASNANEKQPSRQRAKSSAIFMQCTICDKPIEFSSYPLHLQECLDMIYQNFEDTYTRKTVQCPVCEKELPESDLSHHLATCRNLSDIFEDGASVPIEEETVVDSKETSCPICSKFVRIMEMNRHIDVCIANIYGVLD